MFGFTDWFAVVFASDMTIRGGWSGYDRVYEGRAAVSMTIRVLFPGWTPVRSPRRLFRLAKATRGSIVATIAPPPAIFNKLRLVMYIKELYQKKGTISN